MEPCPFEIPHEQLEALHSSPSFQLLRSYLSTQAAFCSAHSQHDTDSQETWLLHRDILHALLMPIVVLYKRASNLAQAALCATKSEDLELAFSGDARGAFVWLQCFLSEEPEWCQTRGCPACCTVDAIRTEHHIRLTVAASLLSTAPLPSSTSENPEQAASENDTAASRSLPPFPQILPALRAAVEKDPFWGAEYWPYLFNKGVQLSNGIQALISSCVDLEALVASPVTRKPTSQRSVAVPGLARLHGRGLGDEEQGMRLKKSKLAKRQLRMNAEEMEIMRRCVLQCWARARIPSKMRNQLLGRGERQRRLTCP